MRRLSLRNSSWMYLPFLALALASTHASAQTQTVGVTAWAGSLSPDWTPAPTDPTTPSSAPLGASVNNPPVAPYSCTLNGPNWTWNVDSNVLYSPDNSTWSTAGDGGYSAWIVSSDPTSPDATFYVLFYAGGYWQFPCNVYFFEDDDPTCGDSWYGTTFAIVLAKSVQIINLTVVSGATQQNTTGGANWATVKTDGSLGTDVLIQATTKPDVPDAWNWITWTGGNGGGFANLRTVPTGTSAMTEVTASIGPPGPASWFVKIWVLWATIEVLTANPKPANAPNFGIATDGTENLGAVTWSNGNNGAGKICSVATITPPGVHDVVTSGWDFKRDRWCHDFNDGVRDAQYYDADWVGDDLVNTDEMNTPDTTDKIYDIDGPNIGAFGQDSAEVYDNFREYIYWNGQMCSDYAGWYYEARWKKNAAGTNQVTLNVVSTGALDLNNFAMAFYPPPGGGGGGCPPPCCPPPCPPCESLPSTSPDEGRE